MTNKNRWLIKGIAAASAAIAIMYFFSGTILEIDPLAKSVIDYSEKNNSIVKKTGHIQKIKVIKRVSVNSSDSSEGYQLYTLSIRGTQSTVTAVFRVKGNKGTETISIESLE